MIAVRFRIIFRKGFAYFVPRDYTARSHVWPDAIGEQVPEYFLLHGYRPRPRVKISRLHGNYSSTISMVSHARFEQRRKEIMDILFESQYAVIRYWRPGLDLRLSDFTEKFQELMITTAEKLNFYNPGLGNMWVTNYPFEMINRGNIRSGPIKKLAEIVADFAPGTYRGEWI